MIGFGVFNFLRLAKIFSWLLLRYAINFDFVDITIFLIFEERVSLSLDELNFFYLQSHQSLHHTLVQVGNLWSVFWNIFFPNDKWQCGRDYSYSFIFLEILSYKLKKIILFCSNECCPFFSTSLFNFNLKCCLKHLKIDFIAISKTTEVFKFQTPKWLYLFLHL